MGFFSPGTSTDRYVGIWYHKIPVRTVVWVANRGRPIKSNLGMLSINTEGHLVLVSHNGTVFWSADSSTMAWSPVLQLLGSGNLVLRDGKDLNSQNYLWQSFDYPSDTYLPGMKLGWDLRTGLNRRWRAWKNWDDPSFGDLSLELLLHNYPDIISKQGATEYVRNGPSNGVRLSGYSNRTSNLLYEFKFVWNKDEVYLVYKVTEESMIQRFLLNQTFHSIQDLIWSEDAQRWITFNFSPADNCDQYNRCGPNGNCVLGETPVCQCLTGFLPKSPKNWNALDSSKGCIRNTSWRCRGKDRDYFVKFSRLKLPDTTYTWVDKSMTLEECKAKCWENCSCNAYANSDIREGGSGCVLWFGDLIDIRQVDFDEQHLYIRLASPEIVEDGGRIKTKVILIIAPIVFAFVMVFIFVCIYKSKRKYKEGNEVDHSKGDMEVPLYDYALIATATDNFSIDKKLGQGGFGPVYKGTLVDGQEIAVKRLSKSSHQGMEEFKNEVVLCSKLQHRNLVKVLGCCINGEEKMLIYEYMPNKSLDSWIFGSIPQRSTLDWAKRFHIICGIARGLQYLHQDSRLKIIHRDLKASNVLLDKEINPKISDFGLARIFRGDQFEENTNKVVGTYGYMAPEYAFGGIFSIKSDVFSFGILLLEIISGIKSRGLSCSNQSLNLIGHVWRLWKEGMPLKLIDACLEDSFVVSKVLRCIHIGLLCIQQHSNDRPNMVAVVIMLCSESDLPQPKEPAFLLERNPNKQSQSNRTSSSINVMSFTELDSR